MMKDIIKKPTIENIKKASDLIKNSGVVVFPTETVYGIGANAYDPKGVAKIFEIKKRPFFDPLIVHIAKKEELDKIAYITNKYIDILVNNFWPGPLTLVLPKKDIIPDIVSSGLETVAVRIPSNNIALQLIEMSGCPIAAPSANLFGRLSPTSAEHVLDQLGDSLEIILDGGQCNIGVESTILDLTSNIPAILRPGGIEKEKIEQLIGEVNIIDRKNNIIKSPGQFPDHYAPSKPLILINDKTDYDKINKNCGVLCFKKTDKTYNTEHIEFLSNDGDLIEAASRLFICLHNLEKKDIDIIYAEKVPEIGLGVAIMDRLYKSSKKSF